MRSLSERNEFSAVKIGAVKIGAVIAAWTLVAAAWMTTFASAVDPYSVISIEPSNPVFHGLDIKTSIDDKRRRVHLQGPQLYSALQDAAAESPVPPNYLNWYFIRKPGDEPVKRLELSDEYSGKKTFTVTIAEPAFYLIPSQTINEGPPQPIPAALNHYVAFRITDQDSVTLPELAPGKPVFVGLPAEHWHHDEYIPITTAGSCLMVYEIDSKPFQSSFTTIDSFGLNTLKSTQQRYIYVQARRSGNVPTAR